VTGGFAAHERMPLPPVLSGRFPVEPKWVDLRAYRDDADKADAKFTELAADFAAAIRGMPKEDLLSQEVKQQRRALRLAFSAAALLLVLAIGATTAGVLAYRAQQEAIAQRDRAERTLAAATRTANSLVFDLAQRFKNAVGVPASLVKDIVGRAMALQRQLMASGQVTPELRRSEAAALIETAATLLAIGDVAGALTAAEGARQIFDDLLIADAEDGGRRRDLHVSIEKVGDVRWAGGDRAGALAAYEESLAISRKLAATDPNKAERQRDVAVGLYKGGDVRLAAGDRAGALTAYEESLAIARKLAAADPGNSDWQRDVSAGLERVADVRLAADDRAGALTAYEEGLSISRKLAAADPGNAAWQRGLYVSLTKIGDVRLLTGDRTGALASYEESLAIMRRLAAADPGNAERQADLVTGLLRVGMASDPPQARAALREALAIAEVLAREGKLTAAQRNWPQLLRERLAKLPPEAAEAR
jgi:tetratricopeptide (TPR) repeat protein